MSAMSCSCFIAYLYVAGKKTRHSPSRLKLHVHMQCCAFELHAAVMYVCQNVTETN